MNNLEKDLQNAQNGKLYSLECRCLANVRYGKRADETYVIIVPKSSVEDISGKVFLVPENGREKTILMSLARISGDESEFRDIFEGRRVELKQDSAERQDVRVDITAAVEVRSPLLAEKKRVLVKNISAGGIFFVCNEMWERGTLFSFEMPLGDQKPVPLVGEVVHAKPMGKELFGHGCRLLPLTADAESQIRRFVFQKLQHR